MTGRLSGPNSAEADGSPRRALTPSAGNVCCLATMKRAVLITGCSSGIGEQLGEQLALNCQRTGWQTFASARDLASIAHLEAAGCIILQLDVTDQASVDRALSFVSGRTGGNLNLLINNVSHLAVARTVSLSVQAGVAHACPFLDTPIEDARQVYEVNVWGVVRMTQAFGPLLVNTANEPTDGYMKQGRICNIQSTWGYTAGFPWVSFYASSKAGLQSLTDGLYNELRPLGVEVLCAIGTFRSSCLAVHSRLFQSAKFAQGSKPKYHLSSCPTGL
jgi:1-acylglycerone phosphate reductase